MNKAVSIPDVQGGSDTRRIAINRVGIRDIRHPVNVLGRDGQARPAVAQFAMYVDLPHDRKGTHMSRFVEILNNQSNAFDLRIFQQLLDDVRQRLEAARVYVEMTFTYFVSKTAPISGVSSLMDYVVTLQGEVNENDRRASLKVVVPVTSLCPCSKKVSDYGAHNQRAHITITVGMNEELWIEDLIDIAESEASSELYALLKRTDEKYVTETAYENPKFVEDVVRDTAARLNADERISVWRVESENFESIHNHSAYAMIERDEAFRLL